MLAFGVGENYDHTGNYIDAPVANWAMITSPTAAFSTAAAQALLSQGFANPPPPSTLGAQVVAAQVEAAQNVPEPAALALWLLSLGAIVVKRR
jgi:hypothetical protein